MKKITKGDYKKRKREIKRTSKKLNKKAKRSDQKVLFLTSPMPFGILKDVPIKKIIDEHWPYWVTIEDRLKFAMEVRIYAEDHYQKALKLKERSKKL